MYLTDNIDALIEKLKAKAELKDIWFVKAFPYVKRPTVLSKPAAVIFPWDLDIDSISIDNLDYSGTGSIAIDLFSPQHLGSPAATDYMQRILSCVLTPNVAKVSVSSVVKDDDTECYKVGAVITFSLFYRGDEE